MVGKYNSRDDMNWVGQELVWRCVCCQRGCVWGQLEARHHTWHISSIWADPGLFVPDQTLTHTHQLWNRSTLTPPSFQRVWRCCQKVASCQLQQVGWRICFLEEGFYARGWWIFRVGAVRILGSASTGHLHFHTQHLLIQFNTNSAHGKKLR